MLGHWGNIVERTGAFHRWSGHDSNRELCLGEAAVFKKRNSTLQGSLGRLVLLFSNGDKNPHISHPSRKLLQPSSLTLISLLPLMKWQTSFASQISLRHPLTSVLGGGAPDPGLSNQHIFSFYFSAIRGSHSPLFGTLSNVTLYLPASNAD